MTTFGRPWPRGRTSALWPRMILCVTALVASPVFAAQEPARPQPTQASAPDSICAWVDIQLRGNPTYFENPPDIEQQLELVKPTVDLPKQVGYTREGDFDFYNDGKISRVLLSQYGDTYMTGTTLLIQHGESNSMLQVTGSDPFADKNAWFIPCQFDSVGIDISECPPFSQQHQEAGLSVTPVPSGPAVLLRGRYSYVMPIRRNGTTYVVVTGDLAATDGYVAVLQPLPTKKFTISCVLHAGQLHYADSDLNATYRLILRELKSGSNVQNLDDDFKAELQPFIAAEKAWVTYKEAQCAFESSATDRLASYRRAGCEIKLTETRLATLKDVEAGIHDDSNLCIDNRDACILR